VNKITSIVEGTRQAYLQMLLAQRRSMILFEAFLHLKLFNTVRKVAIVSFWAFLTLLDPATQFSLQFGSVVILAVPYFGRLSLVFIFHLKFRYLSFLKLRVTQLVSNYFTVFPNESKAILIGGIFVNVTLFLAPP
jgi:hypothetical protein